MLLTMSIHISCTTSRLLISCAMFVAYHVLHIILSYVLQIVLCFVLYRVGYQHHVHIHVSCVHCIVYIGAVVRWSIRWSLNKIRQLSAWEMFFSWNSGNPHGSDSWWSHRQWPRKTNKSTNYATLDTVAKVMYLIVTPTPNPCLYLDVE